MSAFKLGDAVSVLNETIRGKIIFVGLKKSKIEDEDGFIREYLNSLLVHSKSTSTYKLGDDKIDKEIQNKLNPHQRIKKSKSTLSHSDFAFEIDLHYGSLTESLNIKSNYEILQKQLTACRSFIQKALSKKIKRIVIIHGKGEGVLKSEIHLYLSRLESERGVKLDFHDAPYHEYGMGGATEVIFY